MAFDKVIDSAKLDAGMTATAEAIRAKTGQADPIAWEAEKGFSDAVAGIETGGDNTMFVSLLDCTATEIVLPDGLVNLKTKIGGCSMLTSVTFPDTLETIAAGTFQYLTKLSSPLVFPASLKSIGKQTFHSCERLTTITFQGTPESLASDSFYNCGKLTVINCPWAEGAVADAPWGATNATINYNYTGG